MRIATWNVNSIRTRAGRLKAWLAAHEPDVLCLQEIKVEDAGFPFDELRELGYHAVTTGQKTYNGVALISRLKAEDVQRGLDGDADDHQARLISARYGDVRVMSAYVPNGSTVSSDKYAYKKRWLARLRTHLDDHADPGEKLALCGDFNVITEARDANEPDKWRGGVLFNDEMTAALEHVLSFGLVDAFRRVRPEDGLYSWWDYRNLSFPRNDGLRIDHIFATASLADGATEGYIDRDQRKKGACPDGSTASDHVPVVVDFADA